jgi:outer membrane protein OmpA-like peptidoglycan-associated protein
MTSQFAFRNSFPGQVAFIALASALSISAAAQQPADGTSSPTPSTVQPSPGTQDKLSAPPKEGFWGKVNPFARKKWVDNRVTPIRGELNELDEVNAKNARDIKDVDSRATAGINKAQASADQANQVASAAGDQAKLANTTAGQANGKVNEVNTTVKGLDQYNEKNTVSISFKSGSTVLSADAKQELDSMATSLSGHQGYLLEVEAHAPGAGSVGIQNSSRYADAVKRYLVTEHQIPVYRIHSVSLGNAPVSAAATGDTKPTPVRKSYVELRLMENSLAAKDGSTPRLNPSQSGAAQQ